MDNNSNTTQLGFAITTFDNPYDPFDDFTSWYLFDNEKGYNTCGHLARVSNLSEQMTEKEKNAEIERAIDSIIENDFLYIYKKVSREEQII